MVKDENLSTFAKLISIEHYLMKQMNLKNFYHILGILLFGLVLASCNKTDQVEFDPSKDAQIYEFRVTSKTDTNNYFNDVKFSIDQVNGLIFNIDSLPYLFDVDSISLIIKGYGSSKHPNIEIGLINEDSTYTWDGKDSIILHRLNTIEVSAQDKDIKLKYDISINIHQQDPYIFNWDNIVEDNYLGVQDIDEQQTVSYNGSFYTYYKQNGIVKAFYSSSSLGDDWLPESIAGFEGDIELSSIFISNNDDVSVLYCINTDGVLFTSDDASTWRKVATAYPIRAIYGDLPHKKGDYRMLLAVEDAGKLKFGLTVDFSSISIHDELKHGMPVTGFSSISLNREGVYASESILVCGGKSEVGVSNKGLWMLKENNNMIDVAENTLPKLNDANIFYYDDKPYMFVSERLEDGELENRFYFSKDSGVTWIWGGESQALDEDMDLRTNVSLVTDSKNYIWIFGGKSKSNATIVDVWRGRLNKLAK